MTSSTDPAKWSGIPASIKLLSIPNSFKSSLAREATNSRCRMQVSHHVKNAPSWDEFSCNRSLQVLHILQFEQLGRSGDIHIRTMLQESFLHHRYDNRMLIAI